MFKKKKGKKQGALIAAFCFACISRKRLYLHFSDSGCQNEKSASVTKKKKKKNERKKTLGTTDYITDSRVGNVLKVV